MAKDFGAPFVDIIGQVMPLSVDGMIPVIRKWIDMADEVGIPIQFETHRNCITNDLYATLCLIDAVPEMRLCADLSHFVVDREFKLPLDSQDQILMQRIIERSDSFRAVLPAANRSSCNWISHNMPNGLSCSRDGGAMVWRAGVSGTLRRLYFSV